MWNLFKKKLSEIDESYIEKNKEYERMVKVLEDAHDFLCPSVVNMFEQARYHNRLLSEAIKEKIIKIKEQQSKSTLTYMVDRHGPIIGSN